MRAPPTTLRTLVVALEILAIFPALGVAVMSGLLFDAPGSEANPFNWMIVYGALGYPVVAIVSAVAGRFLRDRPAWSWSWLFLPALPVLVGVAGIVLDATVCGGKLACRPFAAH